MTPYARNKLKECKTCKHHVSIHKYEPDDSKRNQPPKKCGVPNCPCVEFVRTVARSKT
jgi:hypothetical protein